MNIGKALGIIGLTIVGSILAAVGVRVTLNAIDGKPLLEAPNNLQRPKP